MKILTYFLLLVSMCDSYKVLVYSNLFGHSHVKMLGSVADTITDAGHDVTVLMPIIDANEVNRTGLKSTKKVIFVEQSEIVAEEMKTREEFTKDMWSDSSNPLSLLMRTGKISNIMSAQCNKVLSEKELLEKLKAQKFDLAITEPFDFCGYAVFDAIGIPAYVSVLASGRFDHVSSAIGQPAALSYVPGTISSNSDRMSIMERFMNVFSFIIGDYMFSRIADYEFSKANEVLRISEGWRELVAQSSFIFTNRIAILDYPAPTLDKIIPIGGVSVRTEKSKMKIEQKWDTILSIRNKNIFISFGSNARSVNMPEEYKKSLLKVFESMPNITFIWKYEDENDKLAAHLDNVHLGSWLPQNDLLADSRLSLFLTHGGMASTMELALMGKPCVMVPVFADQGRNAEMMKRHGGVEVLKKTDLGNWKKIKETIEMVLYDSKYQKNAEKLADMLNHQPTSPKEILVKHVEFAAKFGKLPNMDPYGRHQSFIQYFLLDIISIFIISSLLIIYFLYRIFSWLCCSKNIRKSKSE